MSRTEVLTRPLSITGMARFGTARLDLDRFAGGRQLVTSSASRFDVAKFNANTFSTGRTLRI